MQTKTEIANQALALLSAGRITNITDNDNELSRAVNAVFDITAKQVIRSHRWNCCVRRATLVQLSESPTKTATYGFSYKYQLPSDSLRFLDLNGEPWSDKQRYLSVEGLELHTNDSKANIRYLAWVSNTEEWDVLLGEAVAVKLAMRIARRITKDGVTASDLEGHYQRVVSNAIRVDAMEVGSGENSPLERILDSSPLVNSSMGYGAYNRRNSRLGLEIDYSVE